MSTHGTNTPNNSQDPYSKILRAFTSLALDSAGVSDGDIEKAYSFLESQPFDLKKAIPFFRENDMSDHETEVILSKYVKAHYTNGSSNTLDFFKYLKSNVVEDTPIESQPSQDAVGRERTRVQEQIAPQLVNADKSAGVQGKHIVGALGLSGAAATLVACGNGVLDHLNKKPVTLKDLQIGNVAEYNQVMTPEEHKLLLGAFEDISSLLSDGDTILSMDIDGNFSEMQLDLMASLNRAMAACNNELDPTNMLQEVPESCEDSIQILKKMTDGKAEEILAELGKKQGFNVNMQIKTLDMYMDMADTHTIELDTLKKDPNTDSALLILASLMVIFSLLYILHALKQGGRLLRKDETTGAMDNIHAAKDIDDDMYPMIKMVSEKMRILRPIFDRIMKQQNNVPDIYKSEIDDLSSQKPAERPLTPDEKERVTEAYNLNGLKRTDNARRTAAEEGMNNSELRVEGGTNEKTDWERGTSNKIVKPLIEPVEHIPLNHKGKIYQIQEDSFSGDKIIYVFDENTEKYMDQLYTNHGITDIDASHIAYEGDHNDPNQIKFVHGMIGDQKVWLSLSSEEIRKR